MNREEYRVSLKEESLEKLLERLERIAYAEAIMKADDRSSVREQNAVDIKKEILSRYKEYKEALKDIASGMDCDWTALRMSIRAQEAIGK